MRQISWKQWLQKRMNGLPRQCRVLGDVTVEVSE